MEVSQIKPRLDETMQTLEAETAQSTPVEQLLDTERRQLHVQTGILVLLSAYTFYIASPVLIPLTISVLITMLLAPVMNIFEAQDTAPAQRRARDSYLSGDPRRRGLRLIWSGAGMVAEVAPKRRQNRPNAARDQEALRSNSAGDRATLVLNGGTESKYSAKNSDRGTRINGATFGRHGAAGCGHLGFSWLIFFLLSSGDIFAKIDFRYTHIQRQKTYRRGY